MRMRVLLGYTLLFAVLAGCAPLPGHARVAPANQPQRERVTVLVEVDLLIDLIGEGRPVVVDGVLQTSAEGRTLLESGRARHIEVLHATECAEGTICAILSMRTHRD